VAIFSNRYVKKDQSWQSILYLRHISIRYKDQRVPPFRILCQLSKDINVSINSNKELAIGSMDTLA